MYLAVCSLKNIEQTIGAGERTYALKATVRNPVATPLVSHYVNVVHLYLIKL